MKRSISKIVINLFLIFTMAFMLSSVSMAATISSSGGDGSDGNPYQLTIGYCEDDTFEIKKYDKDYNTYLRVTFTVPAEVSCHFEQSSPWAMVARNGTNDYGSLSGSEDGTFLAKQGETVKILVRKSSSLPTIHFKSAALSDLSRYCPNRFNGKHQYISSTECRYCGAACTHPKANRSYYNDYHELPGRQHAQMYECQICGQKSYDASEGVACTLGPCTPDNNFPYHTADCTVCRTTYSDDCTFTSEKYVPRAWDEHMFATTCSACGKESAPTLQGHTFENDVCVKCGFKRVVPGKLVVTSIKQNKKVKVKSVYHEARWVKNSYGQWIYQNAYKSKAYNYKIAVKFKKAKNAARYIVSTYKDINLAALYNAGKNKTSFTFTYTSDKKKSKVTLYVIPISETGTPGKAVKKVVKLKN